MLECAQRNYMESVIQALQEVRSSRVSHAHCAPDSMHLLWLDSPLLCHLVFVTLSPQQYGKSFPARRLRLQGCDMPAQADVCSLAGKECAARKPHRHRQNALPPLLRTCVASALQRAGALHVVSTDLCKPVSCRCITALPSCARAGHVRALQINAHSQQSQSITRAGQSKAAATEHARQGRPERCAWRRQRAQASEDHVLLAHALAAAAGCPRARQDRVQPRQVRARHSMLS